MSLSDSTFDPSSHIQMERDTLRLLCSSLLKPVTRSEICRMLDPAAFLEPLHRVIFEEIGALGEIDAKRLLQLLPARVTNRGFPDFDLQDLLNPKLVTEKEIERLFQSALRLIGADEMREDPA
jgi:hypothetical protein